MLEVSYDKDSDVLYVTAGRNAPSYVEDLPDGVMLRRSFENDIATGITVIEFYEVWHHRLIQLSKIISDFLEVENEQALKIIKLEVDRASIEYN